MTVDVPPNTFADLVLPRAAGAITVEGRRARSGAHGVVRVASSAAERHITLSWGHHRIEVDRR